MKTKWTPKARRTYVEATRFIKKIWGATVVRTFKADTRVVLASLKKNPHQGPPEYDTTRSIKIHDHTRLYYRVDFIKKEIELIEFWDNRQDPKKLKL